MEEEVLEQLLECQEQIAQLRRENEALQKSLESKDALLQSLQDSLLSETKPLRPRKNIATPASFRAGDVRFSDGDKALTRAMAIKNGPLLLQTTPAYVPYGISQWNDRKSTLLVFEPDARVLLELRQMQTLVADKYGLDGREFVPFLRSHQGALSALRVGLSKPSGMAFDLDRRPVTMEACVSPGAWVAAIVSCQGVWFTESKFGMSWTLVQVQRTVPKQSLTEYAFTE